MIDNPEILAKQFIENYVNQSACKSHDELEQCLLVLMVMVGRAISAISDKESAAKIMGYAANQIKSSPLQDEANYVKTTIN